MIFKQGEKINLNGNRSFLRFDGTLKQLQEQLVEPHIDCVCLITRDDYLVFTKTHVFKYVGEIDNKNLEEL